MKRAKLVFGFPDIHFPDQEPAAYAVAMRAHAILKPDISVCGNDLVNCTPFSGWPVRSFEELREIDWFEHELKPALKHIDIVQKNTKEKTYFLPGNHDDWIERWAVSAGRAGASVYRMLSLRLNLSRGRKNFIYVQNKHIKLHRNLCVVHGWSICKNAAAKHLDLARSKTIIFHHTHRMQVDTSRDPWTDEPVQAYSAGCLCKKQPMWHHDGNPTAWVNGFWIAYIGEKSFTVYPILINEGRCILPDGKEVKV